VAITGPTALTPGTNAQFFIAVSNNGPSDARDLTINIPLPPVEQFVSLASFSIYQWSNTPDAPLTITMPRLPAQASQRFGVIVSVPSSTPSGSNAVNQAIVSSQTGDRNLANNTTSMTTPIVGS